MNKKKSALTPVQEMEFVGVMVISKKTTISLPQKKIKYIKQIFRICVRIYK